MTVKTAKEVCDIIKNKEQDAVLKRAEFLTELIIRNEGSVMFQEKYKRYTYSTDFLVDASNYPDTAVLEILKNAGFQILHGEMEEVLEKRDHITTKTPRKFLGVQTGIKTDIKQVVSKEVVKIKTITIKACCGD